MRAPAPAQIAKLTPPAAAALPQRRVVPPAPPPIVERSAQVTTQVTARVPLPRSRPDALGIARAPSERAAPKVAALTPAPRESRPKAPLLSSPDRRTALYDITGQTVYMPNGERLEAHSGFGDRRDNPRYVKVKNLGPTPPNVYALKLRERLFHGVRAVRMTPVHESKMFGRDGMLAHSYLLGPSGQSNGCVSFKDYDRFLQAFLRGEVDRIVVVRRLDEAPQHLAGLVGAGGHDGNRYAANEVTGSTW